jgi:chromosome segregation ATPase
LLRDQNKAQQQQIAALKREVVDLEQCIKKHEGVRAELEYNMRAAEINVDILKHEMENVRTECELMKAQSEKQMQTINFMKQAQHRLKAD